MFFTLFVIFTFFTFLYFLVFCIFTIFCFFVLIAGAQVFFVPFVLFTFFVRKWLRAVKIYLHAKIWASSSKNEWVMYAQFSFYVFMFFLYFLVFCVFTLLCFFVLIASAQVFFVLFVLFMFFFSFFTFFVQKWLRAVKIYLHANFWASSSKIEPVMLNLVFYVFFVFFGLLRFYPILLFCTNSWRPSVFCTFVLFTFFNVFYVFCLEMAAGGQDLLACKI